MLVQTSVQVFEVFFDAFGLIQKSMLSMFVFSDQISLFLRRNLHFFFLSNNNKLSKKGREMMLDMERERERSKGDGWNLSALFGHEGPTDVMCL